MEGVSGAAGGVDARGEAAVAAGHVGVVRGRVVAEGVGGAPLGGDVGGGLDGFNKEDLRLVFLVPSSNHETLRSEHTLMKSAVGGGGGCTRKAIRIIHVSTS